MVTKNDFEWTDFKIRDQFLVLSMIFMSNLTFFSSELLYLKSINVYMYKLFFIWKTWKLYIYVLISLTKYIFRKNNREYILDRKNQIYIKVHINIFILFISSLFV